MRMEKIDENTIRILLENDDLEERGITGKTPLQATTNHQAEFETARIGFERLLAVVTDPAQVTVLFYTDSQLVSDSLAKHYAKHYQSLVDALLQAQAPFQLVLTQWVPEKQNQGAHTLANQALHSAEGFK